MRNLYLRQFLSANAYSIIINYNYICHTCKFAISIANLGRMSTNIANVYILCYLFHYISKHFVMEESLWLKFTMHSDLTCISLSEIL